MHIAKLRLLGFKSFVEPTELLIEKGLTGVVGPNGCGKSNLLEALRCAPMDKYLTLYDKFLAQQAQWVSQEVRLDAIHKVVAQVGITRAQFDSCRENQAMISGLKWVKERGRELGIIGTPNFFVDGRLVKKVIGIKEIREMVDPLIAGRVASGAGPANN